MLITIHNNYIIISPLDTNEQTVKSTSKCNRFTFLIILLYYFQIREGKTVKLCNQNAPYSFVSSGRTAKVTLVTTDGGTGDGFSMEYQADSMWL